jgi:hypothetical protein
MTFLRSAQRHNNTETLATPLLSRVLQSQSSIEMSGYPIVMYNSYKRLWSKAKLQDTNMLKVPIYLTWGVRRNLD